MTFAETLRAGLNAWNIAYSPEQLDQMTDFNRMVMHANEYMNLTAVPDGASSAKRHFLDSINPLALTTIGKVKSVIDVGSGAGFPGIPLAIMCPNVSFTLLDARKKRIGFLDESIAALGINNVKTLWGRAETAGQDPLHREQYDIACARAVAALPTLLEYLMPFSRIDGHALCYKGTLTEDEITTGNLAARALGAGELCMEKYTLFSEKQNFIMILGQKICQTSTKYPRKPGMPSKKPLY